MTGDIAPATVPPNDPIRPTPFPAVSDSPIHDLQQAVEIEIQDRLASCSYRRLEDSRAGVVRGRHPARARDPDRDRGAGELPPEQGAALAPQESLPGGEHFMVPAQGHLHRRDGSDP